MYKILNKAGNLDLELYRTLSKVKLADLKTESKSDILSQKDYFKPLKVKIPEKQHILEWQDLIRTHKRKQWKYF